jgi:hypothetical protein
LSPPPGTVAAAAAKARADAKGRTRVVDVKLTPPADDDAVRSAETTAVAAMPLDAHSRPTAAIDSGPRDAATLVGPASDGHSGTTRETAGGRKRRIPVAAIAGGVVVVAVLAIALNSSSRSKTPPPTVDTSAAAPAPSAAATVEAALGDSVVVGHGPDASANLRGVTPKTVGADAIALLNLTLPGGRLSVRDTVRVRLDALDDTGAHVTSPQIVWATSNPRIVKFAGPGRLVGVREGNATITVTAATTTGTLSVTVSPRAARGAAGPGTAKRKQP